MASIQPDSNFNPLPSHEGRRVFDDDDAAVRYFNPLPSHEGRQNRAMCESEMRKFQSTPLSRGETIHVDQPVADALISIHSPLTRGDSISLQKSVRIYVSLHSKTMIHRFSELYKPLFAAQSPIFGVRSPRKSHDSFTFARPSAGRGITP